MMGDRYKRIQRIAALALCALCLASLCAGPALAAPTNATTEEIQLKYLNNQGGTDFVAQILTGNSIQVQMDVGDYDLPSGSSSRQALQVTHQEGSTDVATNVSGTNRRGVYEIAAAMADPGKEMTEKETFTVSGNINSITPPKNGYKGTVQGGGQSDEATLRTSQAISERSELTIQCTEGENAITPAPSFTITEGTGYFAEYVGGTIGVQTRQSDLGKPFITNKTITFTLSKPGKTALTMSFYQTMQYSDIKSSDGKFFVDSEGKKCEDQTEDGRFRLANNYFRQGQKYTLTFNPPRSTLLTLEVATPKYVAEQEIRGNIQQNLNSQYLQLKGDDTLTLVAEDSMVLTTKDERYNATFDIHWEWKPDEGQTDIDEEAAKTAVEIPSTQNSARVGQVTARINRQENDVTGVLSAVVLYNGREYEKALAVFPLTIRGTGVPASVRPFSQRIGKANSVDTEYTEFSAETRLPAQLQMDVFAGGIESYAKAPVGPYEYALQLNMGLKNAKSYYAIASLKETDGTGVVELLTRKDGADKPYTAGSEHIDNPSAYADFTDEEGKPKEGTAQLVVRAKSAGTATLTIDYYIMVNGKYRVDSSHTLNLVVKDTAPKTDSTLSDLVVEDAGRNQTFPFGFDPSVTDYTTPIQLPYAYENYTVRPVVNEPRAAEKPVVVTATDVNGNPVELFGGSSTTTVRSGNRLSFSLKETSKVYQLTFTVEAQDPRMKSNYVIFVQRVEPSTDDTLKALGMYEQDDTAGKKNLITGFTPKNKGPYIVTVPYSTEYLRVSAEQNFLQAKVLYEPELENLTVLGKKEYVKLDSLREAEVPGSGGVHLPCFRVKVIPEANRSLSGGADGEATGIYEVYIERLPPSEESRIKTLEIVDAADTTARPKPLAYAPAFNMDNTGPYRMTDANAVRYQVRQVRFKITPMDEKVSSIRIYNKNKTEVLAEITNPAVYSEPVALRAKSPEFLYNEFVIQLIAESGKGKSTLAPEDFTEYQVQIERGEASTDADLLNVALNGTEGQAIKSFAFHRDETSYVINVPYEVRSVSFTAKTSDKNATLQMRDNGNLIHTSGISLDTLVSERESKLYELNEWGVERKFELIVTAEDEKTTKTYAFVIKRDPPSTDALLKKLTVEGITEDGLSPLFKASETNYAATVAENAEGVRITPTANESHATIMVDGMAVPTGQASELIDLLEEHVKIDIVVTAQDGETTKTYTIDFYNQNLVEKTNNADLGTLLVQNGQMTPNFKAAVTEYEVAVKEDTYSVDIIPKPDDPLAEVKVLNGTRELGDYNGNYALALTDGENDVTVQVTSPDKTRTKEYSVKIYRNQEDALKNLKPLTAEMIDWENVGNPIIISLAEYPRVSSDVFTELKKYPEKTIIFQGNDYSLTFHAANLGTLIPIREIYDFRMSFTSPDIDNIKRYMGQWTENTDVASDIVTVYFDYHGDLPGPATLNLSLGQHYGSQYLYWHYYNRERDRIDYYGAVQSNTQGAFSVAIDHFSTYLVTRTHSIIGAENKAGEISRISGTVSGKPNPSTGFAAQPRAARRRGAHGPLEERA